MGAYLSQPVTTKHSSEDSSDTLVVGASSMQGWRVNQEDAHNTILSFDKGIQLFAVYDGHGGAEVATYCSEKLPDFIRQCQAYSEGDLEKALEQAFLELDASLTTTKGSAQLRLIELRNEPDAEDEDDNVANLREEASMPLEEIMAKYQSGSANPVIRKLQSTDGKLPLSPCIRRGGASGSGACSGSSTEESGPSSSGVGSSSSGAGSSTDEVNAGSSGLGSPSKAVGSNSNSAVTSSVQTEEKESKPVSSSKPIKEENQETKDAEAVSISKETSNGPSEDKHSPLEEKTSPLKEKTSPLEEKTSPSEEKTSPLEEKTSSSEEKNSKPQVNGDVPYTKEETAENAEAVSSTTEAASALKNGELETEEIKPKGKGKAKDKTKSISKDDDEKEEKKAGRTRTTPVRKLSSLHVMKYLASAGELSDSDESEDEEDASFEGKLESSDDDDEEEEEEDEDDEDDEEEDEDTDSEDEGGNIKLGDWDDEPGVDSGCTAVVALLRGRDLFVANAGDSRCVVCRNGKAIDMSLDHKPEDAPELARILAAGGKVTLDGRVNGGLNLSRAIGDHAYKQVKNMPATKQMITALPDVRTLRIDPKQDDFMILACDGIWNFMSSQDVVDFVRTRLVDGKLKPSKICEELFDHCLSPNTFGDGTGCDNMTAVIVQFKPSLENEPSTLERETILESPITNETSKKGDSDDVEMDKEKEDEDCEEDETKENREGEDEGVEGAEKEENAAKKRVVESSDTDEPISPKQKKVKVDSEASEANGVQV